MEVQSQQAIFIHAVSRAGSCSKRTYNRTSLIGLGKYQELQTLLHEGLMLAASANDRWGMAMVLHQLSSVALQQQNDEEAVYLYEGGVVVMSLHWESVGNCAGAQPARSSAVGGWPTLDEAGSVFREALATALEAQVNSEALQALIGLAMQLMHEGQREEALELTVRILADAAPSTETRAQALQVRDILLAQLPAEQIAVIEARGQARPLADCTRELLGKINPAVRGL